MARLSKSCMWIKKGVAKAIKAEVSYSMIEQMKNYGLISIEILLLVLLCGMVRNRTQAPKMIRIYYVSVNRQIYHNGVFPIYLY